MNQNQTLADKALALAVADIGQKELTGHNDGTFVDMLEAWYYGPTKGNIEAPWCAIFRSYCSHNASLALGTTPLLPKTDSSTALYNHAKAAGLLLSVPIVGCIGLIRGSTADGKNHDHTFRVETVDLSLGIVHTVDGNWGNQVCRTTHPIKNCDFVIEC